MACLLCYGSNDDLIELNSDEAKHLQIATVLYKYFTFCFSGEPTDGYVCQKCWCKVDVFHQFYVRIENIQENYYKSECVEPMKYETTCEAKELIINDNSQFFENSADDGFDNISVDNDDYFDNDDEYDQIDTNLSQVKDETDVAGKSPIQQTNKAKNKKKVKSKSTTYKCDQCDESVASIYRLRQHQKQEHPEYAFRCRYHSCLETFKTASLLEKHKVKHSKKPCKQCGQLIQSKGMAKHIRQIHEIDQRVVCDLCGKVSSTIYMHRYHVRSDHETHERLQCDICKEWYKNKENLRSHMKSIHIEGPQTCGICGRISTNMKSLAKHQKIHLEGSKERFKCIVCGKGFRDRTKLKEHSYIHSGVTDAYVCQFCGKAFRFGSSMYAHRKKAHPDEMNASKYS